MPSNRRGLESLLYRSLYQSQYGAGRHRCGQRVFRSFEPTAPGLGNMALTDGAEEESWCCRRLWYRYIVGTPFFDPLRCRGQTLPRYT